MRGYRCEAPLAARLAIGYDNPMDIAQLLKSLQEIVGQITDTQWKLIYSLLVLVLAPIVQWLILVVIRKRAKDPTLAYRSLVALRYIISALVMIILGVIWFSGFRYLATYVSIVGAGLVIALQDTVSNLAGFVFIAWLGSALTLVEPSVFSPAPMYSSPVAVKNPILAAATRAATTLAYW